MEHRTGQTFFLSGQWGRGLKGQCHEIFDFWFFSWISFPQASEYTTTAISNFFENSRRYSRLKVHHRCQRHRWQMEKIFKQKNFINFVEAPLGSRNNIYINFCLQVHFKVHVYSLILFPLSKPLWRTPSSLPYLHELWQSNPYLGRVH